MLTVCPKKANMLNLIKELFNSDEPLNDIQKDALNSMHFSNVLEGMINQAELEYKQLVKAGKIITWEKQVDNCKSYLQVQTLNDTEPCAVVWLLFAMVEGSNDYYSKSR